MLKVAAFTGGEDVPGARFRVRQYISPLQEYGIAVQEFFSSQGSYPPAENYRRPYWAAANLLARLPSVVSSHRYDLCILQREFLSTIVSLEPFVRRPRILDVDDAMWVHRGGATARRLATMCDGVICGNAFLAEYFYKWNTNIDIIPTAVDTATYVPSAMTKSDDSFIVGWIGTSPGFSHLRMIEPALNAFLMANRNAKFRVVSDVSPNLALLPPSQFEFRRWSKAKEVEDIQEFDVGIMPLEDSTVARGKCSFKLLQYMSCAKPVVASPIGMNEEVMALGVAGISARNNEEWLAALEFLMRDSKSAAAFGDGGREIAGTHFDTRAVAKKLAHVMSRAG